MNFPVTCGCCSPKAMTLWRGKITITPLIFLIRCLRKSRRCMSAGRHCEMRSSERPAAGAIQPDYVLYGKALDLPNRATNYCQLEFVVTDFHTRAQVWGDMYEVRATR